ncbi:MAG: helix-turn-helix domain-containing protein [Kiloniellales bacterium]|nr:helix-turn-helix domain-containing protein [Kiloniellales bacterium]
MSDPQRLPKYFTLTEAANHLGISPTTVKREIKKGRLGYIVIGERKRIMKQQLRDYINQRKQEPCLESECTAQAKSANSGSLNAQTQRPGAEPGSMPRHDRHAAHRLAQATFKKRSSSSPSGSSSTSG